MLNINVPPDLFMKEIYFNIIRMKYLFDKLYLDCIRKHHSSALMYRFILIVQYKTRIYKTYRHPDDVSKRSLDKVCQKDIARNPNNVEALLRNITVIY